MFKSAEELRNFIGEDAYKQIIEEFGGQRIYINRATKKFDNQYFKIPVKQRNELLLSDYRNGMRPRHISDKYGLKISYTRRLLHILKKKDVTDNAK